MSWLYRMSHVGGRFILCCTMRIRTIRPEVARRQGAFIVACSHISHLDPFLISALIPRPVDWVTRVEFFKHRAIAALLRALNAFEVRRFGVPVSTIRRSIARLEAGRIVGICPDGGVARGNNSCVRGAPIKKGVCLISYRTGVPVLPCIILGSHNLDTVGPWLPAKRGRLWVAFGDRLIEPRKDLDRKAARDHMARELQSEYLKLFEEVKRKFGVSEESVP
ncbi:MAG TPA: lysophospholipid acyltransferase family protein [Tepidisphaeraceae bacterium]|jgi:1-acyl-sn-glycerol-3-phosphate acyltransferase